MGTRGPGRTIGRAMPLGWDEEPAPNAAPDPSDTLPGTAGSDGSYGSEPAPPRHPHPLSRPLSRRARRLLALFSVLALLAALLLGLPRLLGGIGGPQQVTSDFLQAVIDGDLATVRAQSEDAPDASAAALTAQVLAGADDRLESFEIQHVRVEAGTATVTATLRTGTARSEATFTLTALDPGPFSPPEWELAPVVLPEFQIDLPFGSQGIEINGVAIPLSEHGTARGPSAPQIALQLLPGTYEVTLPAARPWLAAPTLTLEAPPTFEVWRTPVHGLHFTLDDDGRAEVERQLFAALEKCAAGVSVPAGCPFALPEENHSLIELPEGTWALRGPPRLDVIPTDAFLWLLHGEGTAEFTPAGPEADGPEGDGSGADGSGADGTEGAEPREVHYEVDAAATLDREGRLEVHMRSPGMHSYGYCVDPETGAFTGVVALGFAEAAAPRDCA